MNYYDNIVNIDNIREAYFEVVEKFEEQSRTRRYRGLDQQSLSDYDFSSEELFQEILEELTLFKPINPALELHIPKRNKSGTRPVYVHTIKERIKSQAVFRIVYPYFNENFSEYLYSYRPSHPHYKAVASFARRYKKNNDDAVLVGDIGRYSDIINPDILKQQIFDMGFDDQTNQLLFLYVDMMFTYRGVRQSSPEGIITGLPITVLFNNLYLNNFDKEIGKLVSFYRRVGDDFIALAPKETLLSVESVMRNMLDGLQISCSDQKISILEKTEGFDFLGYRFVGGVISILPKSIKNIQTYLRKRLQYQEHYSMFRRIKSLKNILYKKEPLQLYCIQLVRQYNLCNDVQQMTWLSDYFFRRLTIYFFGSYTPRHRRKARAIMKSIRFPSISEYYRAFHSGNYTKESMKKLRSHL